MISKSKEPRPRAGARGTGGADASVRVDDVSRLGPALGEGHVASLRARGISSLLPLQSRAWRELARDEADDEQPPNLLVVAPTSAGKTLIAELAIARALRAGRRAFYLAPTRALAEEKFAEFSEAFGSQGARVACVTRERPDSDLLVARGEFDLLVAVFEKMNHHLIARPEILAGAGVVVADEIHLLGDPERGATLDLLLTKLLLSPHRPRVVGLSAVPGQAAARSLGERMGATLLFDRARPRPLHEGVLDASTGRFAYREAGAGRRGETTLLSPDEFDANRSAVEAALADSDGGEEPGAVALMAAALALTARGEQALVFAPTRSATRRWAEALASARSRAERCADHAGRREDEPEERANESPDEPADERDVRLASDTASPRDEATAAPREGREARRLRRCMAAGVAFHNADLAESARRDVEAAFRAGALDLVVSTSTLGVGVNLACRNVLQYPTRLATDPVSGRPVRLPLGRARFSNQGGRAGRLGRGRDAGRSLVVALSSAEAERLRAAFLEAPPEPPEPPPTLRELGRAALDLLAGGFGRTAEGPARELARTFAAAREFAGGGVEGFEREVARALESLRREGLVARDAGGAWWPTARGERAAALGISPAGVRGMLAALGSRDPSRGRVPGDRASEGFPAGADALVAFELLRALAATPEGRRARASVRLVAPCDDDYEFAPCRPSEHGPEEAGIEPTEGDRTRRIEFDFESEEGLGGSPELDAGRAARAPSRDEREAILAARMLLEGATLEGAFDREAGDEGRTNGASEARRAAFEERWRVPPGAVERLAREFAWLAGAAASLAALEELPSRAASNLARALGRLAGLDRHDGSSDSDDALRDEAEGSSAGRITPGYAFSPRFPAPPPPASSPSSASPSLPSRPSSPSRSGAGFLLEINLASPGIVLAAGREVRLSPLGFDFLATLAERPGEVVTRAVLDCRLWPEGGPERDRLSDHRKDLVRKLRPALGDVAPEVAQTVRGIGFRLNLPRERVLLLRESPAP